MGKTISIIILCVGVVLLMLGGVLLVLNLTANSMPAMNQSAETQPPVDVSDPQQIIVVPSEEVPDSEFEPDDEDEEDPSLEPAADFTLKDRFGVEHKLSDFYGKPIIINFWATWCPPCQAELPYFNEAYTRYQDHIQFLMVDLGDGSSSSDSNTIQFVDENGYSFPLFFDSYGEGAQGYDITAIPFTVAINAHGQIVTTHLGSMSEQELAEIMKQLLMN